jgi:hypothetical protein
MARGGMRPTAPQNNPMNVNARGGNGQSGDATQAAKYVPGLPYGEGQALMQTQQSAPLAAAPSIEQSGMPSGLASAAASQPIIGLGEPSARPNEPVTSGAAMGAGPGMEALGPSAAESFNKQLVEDNQRLMQYLPSLELMANDPSASNTFRGFIQYMKSIA